MVQLTSNVPRDIKDPQAHNLVRDTSGDRRDSVEDERVHCLGRLVLRSDRLQVEDHTRRGNPATFYSTGVEIDEEPAFPMRAVVDLVIGLTPDVWSDEVQSSGVPGIPGHPMLRVVMPQGDVAPIL